MDSVSVDDVLGLGRLRRTFWMGYGQDEFKVRPNLTMNLGVRYEYYAVMNEADGHTAVVDFACGGFCPPGTPMYSPDRNNFAPRLSLAWLPGGAAGRTTIRTGFGMYYSANQNDDFSDPHESTAARFALSSADVPNLSYPLTPFLGLLQDQGASPKGIDRHRQDGYYENWDLLIQRQMPASDEPGVNTSATPICFNASMSALGMTPPPKRSTSSRPRLRSSSANRRRSSGRAR